MSYYRNLVPGQFQIGDLVFGRGTNVKVETWDAKPYDINNQDYQTQYTDETRFGWDSFKPTTIEIQLQILNNRMLPGFEYTKPNFWHDMPTVHDFAREWRGDEVRNIWGEMKPLYVCSKLDDIPKIVFGRPGQFGVTADDEYNHGEVLKVLTEYRRADTFAYSISENSIFMDRHNLSANFQSQIGQGPTWLRIEIAGPVVDPVVTLSNLWRQDQDLVLPLNYTIADGETVEISSYPWARRIVNNADPPVVLSALLGGNAPYLDRMRFDFNTTIGVSLSGSSMTDDTLMGVFWRDAFQVI